MLCTANRLNPVVFASLPQDACTLGTPGSYGPDRITRTIYDQAGQVLQEQRAVGTSIAETYATHTYTPDGKEASVYDADGVTHTTSYSYDGFDRIVATTFADATKDQVTAYDNDNNILTRKNRSGQVLSFAYDKLDRMLTKAVPASGSIPANTVTWSYDLVSKVTSLSDTLGNNLVNGYDLAGRQLTAAQTLPGMSGGAKTVVYAYDNGAGDKVDRSKVTWPDGYFTNFTFDAVGHIASVVDSDGTTLASYLYDDLARRASLQYSGTSGAKSLYSWSAEDDLLTLQQDFNGGTHDVAFTNTFSPAHQWATSTISNSANRLSPPTAGSDVYGAVNGVNEYGTMTPAGGTAQTMSYDTRGNLTGDGTWTFAYDPENRLMTASKTGTSASYAYDPLGRRTTKTVGSAVTNFLHDGDTEIGEYDASGNLLRRFVPGTAINEPIAMVDYTVTGNPKTFFHADKMGSVIATSKTTGAFAEGPFVYDAYGNCTSGGAPCATGEPYRYTGQRLDPETGLLYYRARYYSSVGGRFLQTDPIGYEDDLNLYSYVENDPTDKTDSTGQAIDVKYRDIASRIRVYAYLKILRSGAEGPMINKIEKSKFVLTIAPREPGDLSNKTVPDDLDKSMFGPGTNVTIHFDPNNNLGGMDDTGSWERPAFVGLGHEIPHAFDDINGDSPGPTPGNVPPGTTPAEEKKAIEYENKVRKENNLPLRSTYAPPSTPSNTTAAHPSPPPGCTPKTGTHICTVPH